ncbi:hypothetical protein GCM10010420_20760 [Streptomyces glaucosporus]|uniref:Integral membrane protein n=1 Tax=Streptomyces glaucosporus TaxID=284044 RepID=A0ABP5V6E3_9ACTN
MNDRMLQAYAATRVHAGHWAKTGIEKFRKRYAHPFDRGQTALEYLGIIMVVVVIIGAIVGTGIGGKITQKINEQVDKIKAG